MTHSRNMIRPMIVLALISLLPGILAGRRVIAQGPEDPAEVLEALALRVHRHNLRTGDFTVWTGGDMGDQVGLKPTWALGDPLIDWKLPGFREQDQPVSWQDITRPTVLNVWASWCPPCIQEFPDLIEIALAPDEHVHDVLFINAFDDESAALAFLSDYSPDIHILSDPEGTMNDRVGSQAIPTSILLDADGSVLAIHVGSFTPAHAAFFAAVVNDPGVGSFDAADYANLEPLAELSPVDVESALSLEYDDAVSGMLGDDDFQHAYRLEGRAGDVITVQMARASHDLEPYVVLLTENGERLDESRDYSYEPSAMIEAFTLPADGGYIVVATRFLEADGLSSGEYELVVIAE